MRNATQKSGWIFVMAISFFPVIIWSFMMPIGNRFSSFALTLTSFGQISALAGMAMFSLNLILSARLKFLEKYFNGLNIIYIKHHSLGGIAFILLLFHPLFLGVRYIPLSLRSAALFFLPDNQLNTDFGKAALAAMMLLLVITFFIRWRYHIWKFSHKFLGFAFFLASLHVFFISSDVSANIALRAYMIGLALFGIAAFSYRTLFENFLVEKFRYAVERVTELNSKVVEVEMSPINKAMQFEAGQFLFVSFRSDSISPETHPFSITSAKGEKKLRVVIKSSGDYTSTIKNLKTGSLAIIEGPFGRFDYKNSNHEKQVWIAGGIGITPFLSMARSLKNETKSYAADLYYCTNNKAEAVFLEELMEIASIRSNIKVIPFYSEERGRIESKIIEKLSGPLSEKDIFLCGPPPMMKSLRKQFVDEGIQNENVHSEEFQLR